ncbi:unnamed protein product [Orchesella dallaii]|uniref:CRAL-TRIO domain-containing protein n=1 Tax=Orchesella dallaii TaxID=48710 RepID=A0ABP1RWS8_9HEXA
MASVLSSQEMDIKDQEYLKNLQEKIAADTDEKFKSSVSHYDDEFLLRFVRGRKHNVEKAFKTLKNHLYVKEVLYKDLFDRLKATEVQHALNNPRMTSPLKRRDDKGRLIGLFSFGEWNPDEIDGEEILLTWILQAELIWTDVEIQRNGIVLVSNTKGFGLKHMKIACNLKLMRLMYYVFLDCYPLRIRAMHFVENGRIYDVVLKLNKAFMSAKLRSRVFSHHSSDWSTLHKYLPAKILPDYLGGELTAEEAIDLEVNKKILAKENLKLEFKF